ncbi:MAG: tetrahydrofolate dehydrogenase/cyclohydrolase catalytic domain-containing protein, partial [Patescibacteria group bacterium]
MAGQRIDGREISEKIYQGLKDLHESKRKRVTFAVFNTTPAILSFIERKEEIAHKVGIETIRIERTPRTTEEAISVIEDLNASDTNGIVVQLPLPEGVDTETVL